MTTAYPPSSHNNTAAYFWHHIHALSLAFNLPSTVVALCTRRLAQHKSPHSCRLGYLDIGGRRKGGKAVEEPLHHVSLCEKRNAAWAR